MAKRETVPRIESLRVQNYRALKDLKLGDLTPITVLLGPNGSGKSTVFDIFAFLSECFETSLRAAWDKRGRAREIKTRDSDGPVLIEIKYREPGFSPITYHLEVDEEGTSPVVVREWLQWSRKGRGKPFHFLQLERGRGSAVRGEKADAEDMRESVKLASPDYLGVNALGQFAEHPRVGALRDFITGWHVSHLSADSSRAIAEPGPQEHLSRSGDNLANVIQHLKERHPDQLQAIFERLRQRVPRIENVLAKSMEDGRLLLQIKDAPFSSPVLARFASDGTLKMLAYLVLLNDPDPAPFLGIEEPENFLHPRLLRELAEECRAATVRSQLLVTTHSPFFLNGLAPEEVRVLWRDEQGYTQAQRVSDIGGVHALLEAGAQLGHLWMENHFGVGDPIVNSGAPTKPLGKAR